MIVCKFDAVRSTDALEREGHVVTERLRAQVASVAGRLLAVLPADAERFLGQRQGDGLLLGAPRRNSLPLLQAAMTLQELPAWLAPSALPLRFSLGIVTVSWEGQEWGASSVPNGRGLTIVSRLMEQCPSGGIVINRDLHQIVREYGASVRDLFTPQTAELKGISEPEGYWLMVPRGQR